MDKGAEGSPRKRLEVYCLTPATQTSRSVTSKKKTASGIRRVYISFLCSYAPSSGGWPLVTRHVEEKGVFTLAGVLHVALFGGLHDGMTVEIGKKITASYGHRFF